jgi:hypothetical protein
MVMIELAPGIVLFSNVMPEYLSLPQDIEDGMLSAQRVWESAGIQSGTDKYIRDTDSFSIPYINGIDENFNSFYEGFNKTLANTFYSNIKPLEDQYMANYKISCLDHDAYQILKYGPGQHFVNHIDDSPMYPRRVSVIYYMNDNYEGGEISFPRFNVSYKPKANEMLIFPSGYTYNHSVSEVTAGNRYAMVSWIK